MSLLCGPSGLEEGFFASRTGVFAGANGCAAGMGGRSGIAQTKDGRGFTG